MDPLSAGIAGGASLIGGLFNIGAQRAAQRRNLLMEAAKQEADSGSKAAEQLSQGQRAAFNDLLSTWRQAMLR